MRKFLTAFLMSGAALAVAADDKKPVDDKKAAETKKADDKGEKVAPPKRKGSEPALKVGDKAPAFKPDKWLQGDEVKEFQGGKTYVVEFWATWCGPCIVMMPHMGEMQHEYKDKGVTFVGFSAKDPNNTAEKVAEFVTKRGPKLGYTFAFGDNREVYEAWMTAAGQGGIPCCFVVDKTGSIAYIGHPMYLDVVLPKVVDGSWKIDEDVKKLDAIEEEVNAVFAAFGKPKAEDTLKVLAEFEAKYPALSKIPYFVSPKLSAMIKAKKYDDVKILAKNLIARGTKSGDDALLGQVSSALRGSDAKGQKDLLTLSVKAADEALKLAGDKDLRATLGAAQANFAAGDKAKGNEYAAKAIELAEARSKTSITLMLAQSAISAGDKASGVELAEKVIAQAPAAQKASMMASVAGFFVAAEDKATAEEYAKKAVEASNEQNKAMVYSSLAQAYLTAKDKKAGDDYAKQAIESASNESAKMGIYLNLARAYYGAGEKVTARGYAEKALENAPSQASANLKRALQQILNDPEGKSEK